MQQRVSLARVLVHDPDLLLLDEPASGLDPRARIELMDILRELRRLGKTIFISSHILSELAELCDSVTIIDRGEVKFSGPMDSLLDEEQETARFQLRLLNPPENATDQLNQIAGIQEASIPEYGSSGEFDLELSSDVDSNQVLADILGLNISVLSFSVHRKQLNQAFMDLTTQGVRS